MEGVFIFNVKDKSVLAKSGITDGDVIVAIEGEKIKNIASLLCKYQENLWHGKINLKVIHNQNERNIKIQLQ